MNEFDKKLAAQLAQLDKEKVPEKDLWPGIAYSINNHAPAKNIRKRNSTLPAVAASVVLFAAILLITQLQPVSEAPSGIATGAALVQAMSQQHEQQKSMLLTRFSKQPAVTDDWQQQLKELDEAAAAVRRALTEDPDNTALLGMLQHIYQQQLLLIERVHAPKWQQI